MYWHRFGFGVLWILRKFASTSPYTHTFTFFASTLFGASSLHLNNDKGKKMKTIQCSSQANPALVPYYQYGFGTFEWSFTRPLGSRINFYYVYIILIEFTRCFAYENVEKVQFSTTENFGAMRSTNICVVETIFQNWKVPFAFTISLCCWSWQERTCMILDVVVKKWWLLWWSMRLYVKWNVL